MMKRKAISEQSESAQKRHPRQDPVSCESCRRKKLKCDRQQPCGSCVSRQLTCAYGPPRAPQNIASPRNEVQNVEKPKRAMQLPVVGPQSPMHNSRESLITADWLEHIHMADRVPAALSPQLRAGLDGPSKGSTPVTAPEGPCIPFSTINAGWVPNENPVMVNLVSSLPPKTEVLQLFKYYCNYIDYLYHIIVPRTVEKNIHTIYECVDRGSPPNLDQLAVLFAITGSALYFQLSIESSTHAQACIQQFSFLAGAALMQSNYITYPTIPGLQAALIILHHVSNVHCHVAVGSLFTTSSIIHQAKNLKLHCMDTAQSREERQTGTFDAEELEVRRRLWWDVASFDWLLGFLSGPQEWTYLINPEFMHTEKPANVDDLIIGNLHTGSPSNETPTNMSFFLERLKLAEVCRLIVDGISSEQLRGGEVNYSKILELDRKLHQVQNETPAFLRLDATSRRRFAGLYVERPTLAWQRCLLQQSYYSRLCRLHRPFFIRGARDPAYSYSHVVCLQSARKVLEIKRIMDEEEPRFMPSSSAVWSVMHHVFMAAVVLLLDVCYNGDDILADKRKEEVLEACRMLSKAQRSSSLVKEGINAMMSVFQRHYQCGKQGSPATDNALDSGMLGNHEHSAPVVAPSDKLPEVTNIKESSGNDLSTIQPQGGGKPLEDIWSEILESGGNMDFDTDDWTCLFTDLNNAGIPGN